MIWFTTSLNNRCLGDRDTHAPIELTTFLKEFEEKLGISSVLGENLVNPKFNIRMYMNM